MFDGDPRVCIIPEPVDVWDEHGLLSAAYNRSLNMAAFQHAVLVSLLSPLLIALQSPSVEIIICERSPWSNYCVFALSNLSGIELTSYTYAFTEIMRALDSWNIDVSMVYMEVSVAEAHTRIQERDRHSERNSISTEYLCTLKDKHDHMIRHIHAVLPHNTMSLTAIVSRTIDAMQSHDAVWEELKLCFEDVQ